MAQKHLGPRFDIHCGGEDHLSVHHVNEIAQAEVCYGTRLASYWMHGRFLVLDGDRMSKSSGSFLTLDSLVASGYDPLAYRLFLLGAHYRRPLSFGCEALDAATVAVARLRRIAHDFGLAAWAPKEAEIPAEVMEMVRRRTEARVPSDYAQADELRDRIRSAGFEVEDLPGGPAVRRRS